jgi:cytochrome P450
VVDYVQQFAFPFPLRVIMEILGIPVEDLSRMRQGADAVTRLMTAIVPAEEQMELVKHVLDYEQYWLDLIAERRVNPREDIISTVLRDIEAGEGKLSIPELVSTISANLVLAGHETTARALANGLYLLLTERARWQSIVDDPKIISKMVDELLRFDSTVMGFFRTTTVDVELGGVTIPKGSAVFPIYNSANVEAARFSEPNQINPQRPNLNEHLGFGRGIHFCLGAHLARLELRIALESLVSRWPRLRIANGAQVIHAANLTQRGPAYLPLALD